MVKFHTYEDLPPEEQSAFLEKQGMTENEYLKKRNANLKKASPFLNLEDMTPEQRKEYDDRQARHHQNPRKERETNGRTISKKRRDCRGPEKSFLTNLICKLNLSQIITLERFNFRKISLMRLTNILMQQVTMFLACLISLLVN